MKQVDKKYKMRDKQLNKIYLQIMIMHGYKSNKTKYYNT